MKEPTTTEFNLSEGEDRAVFPMIYRRGMDTFVLVPKESFELVEQTDKTIILKMKDYDTQRP